MTKIVCGGNSFKFPFLNHEMPKCGAGSPQWRLGHLSKKHAARGDSPGPITSKSWFYPSAIGSVYVSGCRASDQ